MKRFSRLRGQFWPLLFILIVFFGNSFGVIKAISLGAAIVFLGGKIAPRCFDSRFFFVFSFTVLYFVFSSFDPFGKTEVSYSLLLVPPMMYAGGKWFGYKTIDDGDLFFGYLIIGAMLASMAALGVVQDVMSYGFVGGGRSIETYGSEGQEISATVLGGTLIVLTSMGGVVFAADRTFGWTQRIVVFLFFLLGLFVALRLGSRTQFVIGIVMLIISLILNGKKNGILLTVVVMSFVTVVAFSAFEYMESSFDIFNYFQDRLDDDEFGSSTAGGRTDKWSNALILLSESPFGWGIDINGYSHNFWLDAARNGGWISFIMSLGISFGSAMTFYLAIRRNRYSMIFLTSLVCLFVGFNLLFFVEPILDGFVSVFSAYCCLWGIAGARCEKRLT